MTFRIGVLPAASRNTPTPTSILSARGSALANAISASSESFTTGGRPARPWALTWVWVSMSMGLAKSRVVIHRDPVAERYRLAGQHVAVVDLFVGEAVVDRHLDLSFGHLGAAGRAHAGLACKGRWQTGGARAVQDVACRERNAPRSPVERDGDRDSCRLGLQLRHLLGHRPGGTIGGEALDMDTLFGDVAVAQRAFSSVHHRSGTADEPPVDFGRVGDQARYRLLQTFAAQHAVEQLDVLLLGVEEMIDFEPAEMLVLQSCERFEKDHRAAVAIAVEQGE